MNSKAHATHHIKAEAGQIAPTVIMMGDPNRARTLAERHLENAELICDIRSIQIWTGEHNGKKVTVMGHGMGISSIAIYAHELFEFFEVEEIIRLGSCASYDPELSRGDIIIGDKYWSYSRFAEGYGIEGDDPIPATPELVERFEKAMEGESVNWKTGGVYASLWFYAPAFFGEGVKEGSPVAKAIESGEIIGKEMEASALQVIANHFGKKAITVITVIDNLTTKDFSSADDKVDTSKMLEIALKAI